MVLSGAPVVLASGGALPSNLPATSKSPVSTPARIVKVPNGFVRLIANNRTAICKPEDQSWVHDALAQAPAATQPSTRPVDLLSRIKSQKQAIADQISRQLALPDKARPAHFVNDTLIPLADRMNRLHVNVIYVVVTRDVLKQLVIGGWCQDQFHYNRVLDKIAFDGMVELSPDGEAGESVLPAPYLPDDAIAKRAAGVREDIIRTESGVAEMISREAQSTLQLSLAKFISEEAIAPLKLKLEEDWFAAGVVGDFSSELIATISGAREKDIVGMIARPDPNNPVAGNSIDLLNPVPPDQLRPEIAVAYGDTFRRRSIALIASWSARTGPDAIPKALAAIRAEPPADGPALVKLITKTSGIDLTSQLGAQ